VPSKGSDGRKVSRLVIYVEDGLILLSIALLFWLWVLHRREDWARIAMIPVLGMMLVVFVHRVSRVHRAMRNEQ